MKRILLLLLVFSLGMTTASRAVMPPATVLQESGDREKGLRERMKRVTERLRVDLNDLRSLRMQLARNGVS